VRRKPPGFGGAIALGIQSGKCYVAGNFGTEDDLLHRSCLQILSCASVRRFAASSHGVSGGLPSRSLVGICKARSPVGGRRSGVLQPDGVVNRVPELLLAPKITLGGLDRSMTQEKLDLLQLAAREMA
jgi:hypothetical protein